MPHALSKQHKLMDLSNLPVPQHHLLALYLLRPSRSGLASRLQVEFRHALLIRFGGILRPLLADALAYPGHGGDCGEGEKTYHAGVIGLVR